VVVYTYTTLGNERSSVIQVSSGSALTAPVNTPRLTASAAVMDEEIMTDGWAVLKGKIVSEERQL
jgi:hypothetical protein